MPASVMTIVTSSGLDTSYSSDNSLSIALLTSSSALFEEAVEGGSEGEGDEDGKGKLGLCEGRGMKVCVVPARPTNQVNRHGCLSNPHAPISLLTMLSSMILSVNLYVSQQHTTGTPCPLAIIATMAVPARAYMAPLLRSACVPRRSRSMVGRTEDMAERRT